MCRVSISVQVASRVSQLPLRGGEQPRRTLSERDICTKFITPALRQAGWDEMSQIREEVRFTKGRIIVRGKLVTSGACGRRAAKSASCSSPTATS